MPRCSAFVLAAPAIAQQQPIEANGRVNLVPARAIFERDWVLMNWALKFYDSDRDILLSPGEAHLAAAALLSRATPDVELYLGASLLF
jgi:hypothetical protein